MSKVRKRQFQLYDMLKIMTLLCGMLAIVVAFPAFFKWLFDYFVLLLPTLAFVSFSLWILFFHRRKNR